MRRAFRRFLHGKYDIACMGALRSMVILRCRLCLKLRGTPTWPSKQVESRLSVIACADARTISESWTDRAEMGWAQASPRPNPSYDQNFHPIVIDAVRGAP